ncbi:mitochondrial outer membrane protein porin of 36 kDa [Prunus yedoensis var. nudiflora]|uniref:Mitochondrial outer membrane protein porin of 36 kDa n=1 Tax=Prunus yedoensis var. nudiflora TaxID=2094558 RepID=A0A314YFR2_PRUYE|nr:mitochondrial outer membrane protein porin of 36 kDa [Prunus yedoensis var. nudiflora]
MFHAKVNSNLFIFASSQHYNIKSVNTLFSFTLPDYGRVELQYENPFVGIAGGIGLIRNSSNTYDPVANLSGVVGIGGSSLFTIGADLAADIATGAFDKFKAGLGFNGAFSTASLSLDKLDTLKLLGTTW